LTHELLVKEGYEIEVMGPNKRQGIWCCLRGFMWRINV